MARCKNAYLRNAKRLNTSKPYWAVPFFCDGCKKEHGNYVTRNKTLAGLLLCDRQYYKLLEEG